MKSKILYINLIFTLLLFIGCSVDVENKSGNHVNKPNVYLENYISLDSENSHLLINIKNISESKDAESIIINDGESEEDFNKRKDREIIDIYSRATYVHVQGVGLNNPILEKDNIKIPNTNEAIILGHNKVFYNTPSITNGNTTDDVIVENKLANPVKFLTYKNEETGEYYVQLLVDSRAAKKASQIFIEVNGFRYVISDYKVTTPRIITDQYDMEYNSVIVPTKVVDDLGNLNEENKLDLVLKAVDNIEYFRFNDDNTVSEKLFVNSDISNFEFSAAPDGYNITDFSKKNDNEEIILPSCSSQTSVEEFKKCGIRITGSSKQIKEYIIRYKNGFNEEKSSVKLIIKPNLAGDYKINPNDSVYVDHNDNTVIFHVFSKKEIANNITPTVIVEYDKIKSTLKLETESLTRGYTIKKIDNHNFNVFVKLSTIKDKMVRITLDNEEFVFDNTDIIVKKIISIYAGIEEIKNNEHYKINANLKSSFTLKVNQFSLDKKIHVYKYNSTIENKTGIETVSMDIPTESTIPNVIITNSQGSDAKSSFTVTINKDSADAKKYSLEITPNSISAENMKVSISFSSALENQINISQIVSDFYIYQVVDNTNVQN